MPPLPTLVCKQCGYVNEGERVYCHGCGAKLDRDVIAAQEQEKVPTFEEKQREVKKIMSPKRGLGRNGVVALIRTALVAALVAAVVVAGHAPEGAVALDEKRELVDTPPLEEMVAKAMAEPQAQRRSLGERDVTLYLRNEHFQNVPAWFTGVVPVKRVYVNFEEGAARLTVGATILDYPVYAGWTGYFRPGQGGALEPVCSGGFIGRMPVHPKLAERMLMAVPMVVSTADRNLKLIQRLASVDFVKGQAIFVTRAAPAATPVAPAAAASAPRTSLPPKPTPAPSRAAVPAPLQPGFR